MAHYDEKQESSFRGLGYAPGLAAPSDRIISANLEAVSMTLRRTLELLYRLDADIEKLVGLDRGPVNETGKNPDPSTILDALLALAGTVEVQLGHSTAALSRLEGRCING